MEVTEQRQREAYWGEGMEIWSLSWRCASESKVNEPAATWEHVLAQSVSLWGCPIHAAQEDTHYFPPDSPQATRIETQPLTPEGATPVAASQWEVFAFISLCMLSPHLKSPILEGDFSSLLSGPRLQFFHIPVCPHSAARAMIADGYCCLSFMPQMLGLCRKFNNDCDNNHNF